MSHRYSPAEIGGYLAQEKLAIHGVSPAVWAQNKRLVSSLQAATTEASDSLLAVQIVGSRSNGTSTLESDVDLIAVRFDTDTARHDTNRLHTASKQAGVAADIGMAAIVSGVQDLVPTDASSFIYWADTQPGETASLFEPGIWTTPGQKLGQLAVTSLLHTFASKQLAEEAWQTIREAHATAYLGDRDRMREKLVERLGRDQAADIDMHISPVLLKQRQAKYGLPHDMKAHHAKTKRWATANQARLEQTPAWALYQDVLDQL